MTVGWCGCCGALRPRYRRLVDNIYPANPDDGLVKANMDKLVWYAMNSPDKLDRIGEYLAHRLYRDIHRKRHGYACVSMDALDQLLVTCHANSLNLFVEVFLQMVQKLLECSEPALQLRATDSFEKFANIREDTPSYHRRYDFLVSKFSQLCYSADQHAQTRILLRTAGIRGLQGVVRKTDWDDLGENIWRPGHMEKLVPSLLYNIQDAPALKGLSVGSSDGVPSLDMTAGTNDTRDAVGGEGGDGGGKTPSDLAESCLRELVARVTFSRIRSVVRPLLVHMDQHKQWSNQLMAVHIFKIIMYSIQAQYSINVVDLLMSHLGEHRTSISRCGIAAVLGQVIPIAAGECVGPSVIEMINSLLEHVRLSMIESVAELNIGGSGAGSVVASEEQQQYQDHLIHALAQYTNHLPDYHKTEAMLFILTKTPGSERVEDADTVRPAAETRLQHLLLNCLLKVAARYPSHNQYYVTFSTSFLARLLRLSVSVDGSVRRLILLTLSALLPRSSLPTRPTLCTDGLSLPARGVPPVRQDTNFWKKCGHEMLASIQDGCQMHNNTSDNYSAAYSVLVQLVAEVRAEDVPLDVIRTVVDLQEWCVVNGNNPAVHSLVAAVMAVVAAVVPQLQPHVHAVTTARENEAAWMLPVEGDSASVDSLRPCAPTLHLLFNRQEIVALLQPTSHNEQRVVGRGSGAATSALRRASSTAQSLPTSHVYSCGDGIAEEGESAASTPTIHRRDIPSGVTPVPFEAVKLAATGASLGVGPASDGLRREEERRHQLTYALLHDSYEALLARQQPDPLQARLMELFNRLPQPCSNLQTFATPAVPLTTTAVTACNPVTGLKPLTFQLPYPDIVIC